MSFTLSLENELLFFYMKDKNIKYIPFCSSLIFSVYIAVKPTLRLIPFASVYCFVGLNLRKVSKRRLKGVRKSNFRNKSFRILTSKKRCK